MKTPNKQEDVLAELKAKRDGLPTKAMLMEEMEADIKILDKYFPGVDILSTTDNELFIRCYDDSGDEMVSRNIRYAPPLVPPKKWQPVLVRWPPSQDSEFETYRTFSLGEFADNGNLLVQHGNHKKWSADWCSINDPSHHSQGWLPEWNVDGEGGEG